MPRKKKRPYSTGEVNKLIDSIFDPLIRKDMRFWIPDTACHLIVEQDPVTSTKKFVRYSLPKILKQLAKQKSCKR